MVGRFLFVLILIVIGAAFAIAPVVYGRFDPTTIPNAALLAAALLSVATLVLLIHPHHTRDD